MATMRKTSDEAETDLLRRLGERVRSRREGLGWTRRRVAAEAELSERFLADVEAGRGNIALGRLLRVARVLQVPLEDLVRTHDRAGPVSESRDLVILLGLRGAGKTTIGQAVATQLQWDFVEQDRLVEDTAGMPLGDLFAVHGETYYRRLAREVLDRFLGSLERPTLLATGGGLVDDPESFEAVRRHGRTVWLQASPEAHWQRVVAQGDGRPMRDRPDAQAELGRLWERRRKSYELADHVIDTESLGVTRAREALAALLVPGSAT